MQFVNRYFLIITVLSIVSISDIRSADQITAPVNITVPDAASKPEVTDAVATVSGTTPATITITIQSMVQKAPSAPVVALKKIAFIRIDGEIRNLAPKAEWLYKLGMKDDVLGVVICINSGGGQAGAAELVQKAIDFVKARNKPVFICVEDAAASGAYMIACAGSKIYAGTFSEVGSIGVAYQGENPEDARKLVNSLAVGKHKRYTYTPEGELTEESKKIVIDGLRKVYLKFRADVSKRRNIALEKIDSMEADTFSGSEALELGLIDAIGSLDEAVLDLKGVVNKTRGDQDKNQLLMLVDEADKELLKI